MMASGEWIGVEWRATQMRAWRMRADGPQALHWDLDAGALTADGFESALMQRIGAQVHGPLVVIVSGYPIGEIATPCPPPRSDAAMRLPCSNPDVALYALPALRQNRPADMLQGEASQIASFLHQNPDFDGVICLADDHSKWVHISATEIVSFQTAMTGEIFGLLSTYSSLRSAIGSGWDTAAFGAAISDALSRPQAIAAQLFTLRAEHLLQGQSPDLARARLMGLLIGLELAASKPYWLGQNIALIGDPALTDIYAQALAAQGITAPQHMGSDLTLLALTAAYDSVTKNPTDPEFHPNNEARP
jgi:2-dehydro-3-deoxygalactonokinase